MLRIAESVIRTFDYPVRCKGKIFSCWVAGTPAALQMGLMGYELPADKGCLLVFPEGENLGLWMKNCKHPLVALFLSSDGKVLSKANMSHEEPNVIHRGPEGTRMALELKPESAVGIEVGDFFEGQD